MDRLSMISRGFDPARLLWRQDEPGGGPAAANPPAAGAQGAAGGAGALPAGGTPPATGTGAQGAQGAPAGDAPPSNADAAARRVQQRVERERDAALTELAALKKANESDAEKVVRERDEAVAKAAKLEAENAQIKLESRIRAAATGKAQNPEAVVKLSADALKDLDGATDAEIAAHVDTTMTSFGLAAGGAPLKPGQQGLPGAGPQGNPNAPAGGDPPGDEATGDPEKDYRKGIGRGLLGIFHTGAPSSADEEGEDD